MQYPNTRPSLQEVLPSPPFRKHVLLEASVGTVARLRRPTAATQICPGDYVYLPSLWLAGGR